MNNHLACVLCQFVDSSDNPTPYEGLSEKRIWVSMGKLIKKIPYIASLQWDRFSGDELWFIFEALGCYPKRNKALETIYESIHTVVFPKKKTK